MKQRIYMRANNCLTKFICSTKPNTYKTNLLGVAMKNLRQFVLLLLFGLSAVVHADYTSPASSANPPETIEQDPSVPSNPNIYAPAKPVVIPPSTTIITPSAPTLPPPAPSIPNNPQQPAAMMQQSTSSKINMQTTNTQTEPSDSSTNTKPTDVPTDSKNNTNKGCMDSDTSHDPDPEAEDVGTAPNQAS